MIDFIFFLKITGGFILTIGVLRAAMIIALDSYDDIRALRRRKKNDD